MNQNLPAKSSHSLRNGVLAILAALGVWYFALPAAHKVSADPKAQILEIGIANASAYQISMWVPAGSTSDSVPGIAHVVEHLKFKTNDGAGFVAFDAIPGSSSNAATSYDTTRYDLGVSSTGLVKALEVLSTILQPLKVTETDLALEKTIVQQELLQRTQSDPDTPFYQEFYSKLYHGLPNENSPGGTQDSVASVSLKNVLDFDAAHYAGTKVFVLISGPELDAEQRAAIDKIFPDSAIGRISVARDLEMTREDVELINLPVFLPQKKVADVTAEELTLEKSSPRARSVKMNVVKLVSAPTPRNLVVAASILRSAVVSRLPDGLYDLISEEPRLVQNWNFSVSRLFDGMWQINFSADVENGVDPKVVRAAFEAYLTKLSQTGLSLSSFDRLKDRNFLLSEWEDAGSRAASLGDDALQSGYSKAINLMTDLHSAKLEDVNMLLQLLQKPGRVGVSLLTPQGQQQ